MTAKPHGRDCPNCSQCLGAPVKRVEQQADQLVVDGVEIRPIAFESPMQTEYRKRRGRGRR